MQIDLTKEDFIHLVLGVYPYTDVQDHPLILNKGRYSDIHGWVWDRNKLKDMTEFALYQLYLFCRDTWPKHNPQT